VVLIAFDPQVISYVELLSHFWENHNPTEGMRQGNDVGSQYRSVIYTTGDSQASHAAKSQTAYQGQLTQAGYPGITTETEPLGTFYYAEEYHQQYLARNPGGYCGIGGTGVSCPIGLATA
jgi:peptide-methionine (S)-S-oxide reductase